MSFHQPLFPFGVMASVINGLPMASLKGPVGVSPTATPIALPG